MWVKLFFSFFFLTCVDTCVFGQSSPEYDIGVSVNRYTLGSTGVDALPIREYFLCLNGSIVFNEKWRAGMLAFQGVKINPMIQEHTYFVEMGNYVGYDLIKHSKIDFYLKMGGLLGNYSTKDSFIPNQKFSVSALTGSAFAFQLIKHWWFSLEATAKHSLLNGIRLQPPKTYVGLNYRF